MSRDGQMARRMETKPGKQVVAYDDDGERHVLGDAPELYIEDKTEDTTGSAHNGSLMGNYDADLIRHLAGKAMHDVDEIDVETLTASELETILWGTTAEISLGIHRTHPDDRDEFHENNPATTYTSEVIGHTVGKALIEADALDTTEIDDSVIETALWATIGEAVNGEYRDHPDDRELYKHYDHNDSPEN